jgi:polysaccharide export outer membrane protein
MPRAFGLLCALVLSCSVGCKITHPHHELVPSPKDFIAPPDMPRELSKTVLPTYTVEPPDILVIEAIHIVPKDPYFLRTGDTLAITVQGTLPEAPVQGPYQVQSGGIVNLGIPYGSVKLSGFTVEQAQAEVQKHMATFLKEPVVAVSLLELSGLQQIGGEHLVGPDGSVTLGSYGSVSVVGMNLAQVRETIEQHLSKFMEDPVIAVDVYAYNSKVYYVITEGAGMGDGVTRFPITGNETVLDAISNINGLTEVSSKKIWIARAVPDCDEMMLLPVDWQCVTAGGIASTNYQIMPGDRVFIAESKLVAADTNLGKFLAPWERALGFAILSVRTASFYSGKVLQRSGGGGGFGGGGVF